jgi:16S rRNA (guanine527-N7)-methyltransferase
VEVLATRAEDLAAGDRRATWDLVTLRAVGSLAECAELGLPLLRPGGLLLCWKREASADLETPVTPSGGLASEVAAARGLVERLGGGTPEVLDPNVPGAPGHRLVLVRKERPTPVSYPRPPAVRRGRSARCRGRPAGSERRA